MFYSKSIYLFSSGGIVLASRDGKIVFESTLDARLEVVFRKKLPEVPLAISFSQHTMSNLFEFTSCPAAFLWRKHQKIYNNVHFLICGTILSGNLWTLKGCYFHYGCKKIKIKNCTLFFFICLYENLLAVPCHLVTVKQVDHLFIGENTTKGPFFCFISNWLLLYHEILPEPS